MRYDKHYTVYLTPSSTKSFSSLFLCLYAIGFSEEEVTIIVMLYKGEHVFEVTHAAVITANLRELLLNLAGDKLKGELTHHIEIASYNYYLFITYD